ncbi:hypothetical protein [Arthrobacter crystallopoietes]|uniref:hypothetical protein n=1 Tax=Crystallibacter crystallopoietes TaxID=37928 RepID=UPI001111282D|nr:hypothetical protein [Arthrobacter crystallopoietes]
MQSKDHQDDPGLKPHVKLYLWALGLPILTPLGFLTPFFEESHLFADGGWWKSLTLLQQILVVLLGWAIWIAAVTVVALLLSFFSRRWQQEFWLPGVRRLRGAISWLGLRLVSRTHLNRLIAQEEKARARREAAAGPPKGTRSGVPGKVIYGKISTHANLYDLSLMVEWRSTGLPLGKLVPSPGDTWEVHYGHLEESGIQPQFVTDENLGRVAAPWEGVELLRKRDLREGLGIQQTESEPEAGNT